MVVCKYYIRHFPHKVKPPAERGGAWVMSVRVVARKLPSQDKSSTGQAAARVGGASVCKTKAYERVSANKYVAGTTALSAK